MKKWMLLAVGAAGAALVAKRSRDAQHEQVLWAEATDHVEPVRR